jgi:hypothetical protein
MRDAERPVPPDFDPRDTAFLLDFKYTLIRADCADKFSVQVPYFAQ